MRELDYTKMRGPHIIICSKCGRKGLLRNYKDGSRSVWHHARLCLAMEIYDSCEIGDPVKQPVMTQEGTA